MSTLNVDKLVVTQGIRLPTYNNGNLPTPAEGLMVYNTSLSNIDFSNGSAWLGGGDASGNDGSNPEKAATSAASLKASYPNLPSGVYWIIINNVPTQVYCEMNISSGGWMLGMNINTSDAHMVFYNNLAFWEQAWQTSDHPGRGCVTDPNKGPYADYKAIRGGNLWKYFDANELLIVVHDRSFSNYYGWRTWDINRNLGLTRYSLGEFWSNGQPNICNNPGGGTYWVKYKYRITNGSTGSTQSGPAGSLFSRTPNSYENQDLITNATNYNVDSNRLTQTNSGSSPSVDGNGSYFPRSDNQGGGFGAYYDTTYGGRPESDAQTWDSGTWTNSGGGRFGNDALQNGINEYSNNCGAGGAWKYHRMWGGKPCTSGGGDSYNWNGYSGYNYSFGIFVR